MLRLKKILVPTDFSSGADKSFAVAQKLASVFGSTVDVIHVIPTVKYLNESMKSMGLPLDLEKDVYPKIMEKTEHQIGRSMNLSLKEENRGAAIVRIDRKPSVAISDFAGEEEYDLIVMSARGKHESGLFRGSTTSRVIRSSKVPVFTVDEKMNEHKIRKILVPTDSSMMSFAAFPLAVQLADLFNSEITLLHILELYGSFIGDFPRNIEQSEIETVYDELIDQLQKYIDEHGLTHLEIRRSGSRFRDFVVLNKDGENRLIPLYIKVERGISAHFEIECYSETEADLVVMATHGRSGLAHLILGSTAEKVAQYCRKPMITVRPDGLNFPSEQKNTEVEA